MLPDNCGRTVALTIGWTVPIAASVIGASPATTLVTPTVAAPRRPPPPPAPPPPGPPGPPAELLLLLVQYQARAPIKTSTSSVMSRLRRALGLFSPMVAAGSRCSFISALVR